jgi:Arc/MetJ family transcription regulator
MRTTLTLDDDVVENVMKTTGEKSPVAAIRHALQAYLLQARKQKLLALRGQVQVEDNWQQLRQLDTQP